MEEYVPSRPQTTPNPAIVILETVCFVMEKTYMSGGEKENIHKKSKEKILIPEKLPINQFSQIKKTKKIHI